MTTAALAASSFHNQNPKASLASRTQPLRQRMIAMHLGQSEIAPLEKVSQLRVIQPHTTSVLSSNPRCFKSASRPAIGLSTRSDMRRWPSSLRE